MKKLIIIPLLIVAISAAGQGYVTSKVLGDQIYLNKGALECTNIIISPVGDTARSVIYFPQFSRDTTSTSFILLLYYNRVGAVVAQENVPLIGTNYTKWTVLITALDIYIHNKRPRVVLH